MTNSKFKLLLDNLRALILKSRPAYRDYIGTEDVIEKTVLISGKLSTDGESINAKDAFKGFVEGETYKVTIGDETVDATAQYGTGSFSGCIVIGSSNVMPSEEIPGWMICVYNENLLGYGTGEWAGKAVEVFTEKTVKVDRWDVKKLPEECLPDGVAKQKDVAKQAAQLRTVEQSVEDLNADINLALGNANTALDMADAAVKRAGDTMSGNLEIIVPDTTAGYSNGTVILGANNKQAARIEGRSTPTSENLDLSAGTTLTGTSSTVRMTGNTKVEVIGNAYKLSVDNSGIKVSNKSGTADAKISGVASPVADTDAVNKGYVDEVIRTSFTFTITPVDGQVSPTLSATRAEMLAALDAGKTLLGYWTETRTILDTTDTIKHEFRLESVNGTGADRGLAFVNYELYSKSALYVNGNDTISFVDKMQLPIPMTKTEAMTQSVGMDDDGRLWTEPGASGLPEGASANQRLVTDEDGNVAWVDQLGGYYTYTYKSELTQTLSFSTAVDSGGYQTSPSTTLQVFISNDQVNQYYYDVTFNGVEYKRVPPLSSNGVGDPTLTKYPFCLDYRGSDSKYHCLSAIQGTVSVTIKRYVQNTVKIPARFVEQVASTVPSQVIVPQQTLPGSEKSVVIDDQTSATKYLNVGVNMSGASWITSGASEFAIGPNWNDRTRIGEGYVILKSSTPSSSKLFKITVDDTGTLTATETT